MRRLLAGASLLLCCTLSGARAQSVAPSFDDPRGEPEAVGWNASLLDTLVREKVRAILFVCGHRIDTPAGRGLVKAWGDAGHVLANHTYAHQSLGSSRVSLETFIADVERNDALLDGLPGRMRLLRFPYLKEGNTAAKRDGMRAWMATHDYRSGAVSIDASDWYYDQRWRAWREAHPDADPTPFRRAYLAHLMDRARYYDALSRTVLGRSVKHVLLLHANAINAVFLPDIVATFRANGWTLIAPDDAYADPVYASRPDVLPAGESVLWSLAKEAGVPDLRYPGEDDVYEKPLLDALGL